MKHWLKWKRLHAVCVWIIVGRGENRNVSGMIQKEKNSRRSQITSKSSYSEVLSLISIPLLNQRQPRHSCVELRVSASIIVIIVVFGLRPSDNRHVILRAEELGMTSTKFVFLVPGSTNSDLLPWESTGPDANNEKAKSAFKQVIVVSEAHKQQQTATKIHG